MNRRGFLKALGLGAAFLAVPSCTAGPVTPAVTKLHKRPNIVFILIDDMGWTDVGCYGSRFHETPNIDRLASHGMKFTDAALGFIEDNKDKPFFLFLSHHMVHIPLEAPEELVRKYENKTRPSTGVNNPVYAAMVEHLDNSVGRILKKLGDLKLEQNTLVVFFSDNGGLYQPFGGYTGKRQAVSTNAPLRDEKGTLYEGGVREPLIVRWPGVINAGTTCSVPVTSVDFYPTFMEIVDAKSDANHVLDGRSILPLLRQTGTLGRDAIYWHYPHYHHSRPAGAIRQGDWKLIEFYEDGRLELYNLKDDIGEKENLAVKMPGKAAELQGRLAAWRKSVGAKMPMPNPDYDSARANEWGGRQQKKPRK